MEQNDGHVLWVQPRTGYSAADIAGRNNLLIFLYAWEIYGNSIDKSKLILPGTRMFHSWHFVNIKHQLHINGESMYICCYKYPNTIGPIYIYLG